MTLLIAGLGIFMVFLDTQILFVAFHSIEDSFNSVSTNAMSWVLSGYTLAFAALLVPAGRLADRWGRRSMFLGGLALFTAASALCGIAPTAAMLIAAARATGGRCGSDHAEFVGARSALHLEGAGADRDRGVGLDGRGSLRRDRPDDRRTARRRVRWRAVFYLNLPFGILGVLAGHRVLVESRRPNPARSLTSSVRRCWRSPRLGLLRARAE